MSDRAQAATAELGRVLFRFRSFTPLPVIALLAWRLMRAGDDGGSDLFIVLGLATCLTGQALRFYTLGLVSEGTSGQGSALEAIRLNTLGPYARVRNPLYLGNLGICLGLVLIAHDVWVAAAGLTFFFGEYFFIIRAEEAFLRQRFGPEFDEYCRRVPRWVPRVRPAARGKLGARFDLRRALKKEHNPFAAWASGALFLIAWERYSTHALDGRTLAALAGMEALVLLFFMLVKAYKRGWLSI